MKTLEMMNLCNGNDRKFYSPRGEYYYQNERCFVERDYNIGFLIEDFMKIDDWQEVKQFTEDELVILRNLPEWAKWIARDEDDSLGVHEGKPNKKHGQWKSYCSWEPFDIYNHLFNSILSSGKEPTRIPGR